MIPLCCFLLFFHGSVDTNGLLFTLYSTWHYNRVLFFSTWHSLALIKQSNMANLYKQCTWTCSILSNGMHSYLNDRCNLVSQQISYTFAESFSCSRTDRGFILISKNAQICSDIKDFQKRAGDLIGSPNGLALCYSQDKDEVMWNHVDDFEGSSRRVVSLLFTPTTLPPGPSRSEG